MGRNSHNGTCAVSHQNIISCPDRDMLPANRVDSIGTGEDASFGAVGGFSLDIRLPFCLLLIASYCLSLCRGSDLIYQWVFRCQDHEGYTPQSIWSGGENFDRVAALGGEGHGSTNGASNPVGLQGFDGLWPIHVGEIQQLFGIISDAEEPLLEVLFDHRRFAAFAVSVFSLHLFAC